MESTFNRDSQSESQAGASVGATPLAAAGFLAGIVYLWVEALFRLLFTYNANFDAVYVLWQARVGDHVGRLGGGLLCLWVPGLPGSCAGGVDLVLDDFADHLGDCGPAHRRDRDAHWHLMRTPSRTRPGPTEVRNFPLALIYHVPTNSDVSYSFSAIGGSMGRYAIL